MRRFLSPSTSRPATCATSLGWSSLTLFPCPSILSTSSFVVDSVLLALPVAFACLAKCGIRTTAIITQHRCCFCTLSPAFSRQTSNLQRPTFPHLTQVPTNLPAALLPRETTKVSCILPLQQALPEPHTSPRFGTVPFGDELPQLQEHVTPRLPFGTVLLNLHLGVHILLPASTRPQILHAFGHQRLAPLGPGCPLFCQSVFPRPHSSHLQLPRGGLSRDRNSVSSRTSLEGRALANLLLPSLPRSLHPGQSRRFADLSGVHVAWSVVLDPPFQDFRQAFDVRRSHLTELHDQCRYLLWRHPCLHHRDRPRSRLPWVACIRAPDARTLPSPELHPRFLVYGSRQHCSLNNARRQPAPLP